MNILLILLIGLISGLSEGLSGAGWGVFSLAMLVTMGVNPLVAVSSSIMVELILGVANNVLHFSFQSFDWKIALPLLASGIIGIIIGSKFSYRIPEQTFRVVLGILVIFFGILMIIKR